MDTNGYLKLADFGVSKRLKEGSKKTQTIVGTPEYVAPEIITQKGHDKGVDWWSYGILLYEMMYGIPPFYSQNQHTMFTQIVKSDVVFTDRVKISPEGKDIIRKLLKKRPEHRLGAKTDAEEIKAHPWFADVDFEAITAFKIKPTYVPEIVDKFDLSNFDSTFTKENPRNTRRDSSELVLIEKFNDEFDDFDFDGEGGGEEEAK